MQAIAGKAVCFGQALKPEFSRYAHQVVANCKMLAAHTAQHRAEQLRRRREREAAANDYRWSSIILGIVQSPSFLMSTASTTD